MDNLQRAAKYLAFVSAILICLGIVNLIYTPSGNEIIDSLAKMPDGLAIFMLVGGAALGAFALFLYRDD